MSETADIDKTDVIKHKNIFKRKKLSFLKLTYFIALQGALAFPYAGNTLLQGQKKLKKEQKELLAANRNVTADRMTEEQAAENIREKISERTSWFIDKNFIPAVRNQYDKLTKLSGKVKKDYIEKEFFDVVFQRGGIDGNANYCIAGLIRSMMDADSRTGDLREFIPDSKTLDGHNSVSCPRFVQYVRKNYPDCITPFQKKIDTSKTPKGSILIIRSRANTSSGLHAKLYLGGGKEAGFNRDYWGDMKEDVSGYVIDMQKIIELCLQRKVNGMTYAAAMEMLTYGMEDSLPKRKEPPLVLARNMRNSKTL